MSLAAIQRRIGLAALDGVSMCLLALYVLGAKPCEVKVFHNTTVLSRPLRHQLKKFKHGEEECVLVFGLVQVQVWCGLVLYLCLGGEHAC